MPAPEKTQRAQPERDPLIAPFEGFLKVMGFKRTYGAIYGLLVLSPKPLSSEEIGKSLGLSQGAVSQGLKNLSHWGAVETHYSPERRAQLHSAPIDSLSIVSTVFQKREKGAIDAFRRAHEVARERFLKEGDDPTSDRILRLNSNITTCEFAQVVMDFVITMSRLGLNYRDYSKTIQRLPKVLGVIMKGPGVVLGAKDQLLARLKERSLWG